MMFISIHDNNRKTVNKNIQIIQNLQILLAFQLYVDLCLLRGWKGIRIITDFKKINYYVIGINPNKKKNNLEIFYPIQGKVNLSLNEIIKFFKFSNKINDKKYLKSVNMAFIEQNGTIAYYRLGFDINKTSGPLGRH